MASSAWLIIAAFNEEFTITGVITDAIATFPNIVVVDDGSKDRTTELAAKAGAHVVRHPINLGQGAALQTGIDFALRKGAEIFITFDADGQHRIEDAVKMAEAIERGEADIICGSRFLGIDPVGMPIRRKIIIKMAAIFTKLTTGMPVTDAHNGLRAFSRHTAKTIRITQNRMAHASEFVSQIKTWQLRYKEMPVQIKYTSYSMKKGQKLINLVNILTDLFMGKITK